MTEKRFTYEYHDYNGNLFDNVHNTFYPIEDSDENIGLLCNRLNKIVDENDRLKEANQGLQTRILSILDYIKEKETITRTEFADYWNNEVMKE